MGTFEFYQYFFKKVILAGLSSLWHQDCKILVKSWIFDDPIHKKGSVLVILRILEDAIIKIRQFFEEKGLWRSLRSLRLLRLPRSMRLLRYLRPQKSPLRSSEYLDLIIQWKILLYFDVSNNKNVDGIIKYQVEYCHFFCQRLLRPTNVTFLKINW